MKYLLAFLLFSSSALAKEIVVKFTEEELRVQMSLNDAALKSVGGPAAQAYVILDTKYKQALDKTESK